MSESKKKGPAIKKTISRVEADAESKYLSVKEAAKLLRCSPMAIHKRIGSGAIPAEAVLRAGNRLPLLLVRETLENLLQPRASHGSN